MATTKSIVMTFVTSSGASKTLSFLYALGTQDANDVKAAMDTIIANGEVFKSVPVRKKSAQLVTTTREDINISD